MHVLSKESNDTVPVIRVETLTDGASLESSSVGDNVFTSFDVPHPADGPWEFNNPAMFGGAGFGTLPKLADVARLAQGLKTSADAVFVMEVVAREGDQVRVRSRHTQSVYTIESKMLRPLVKSEHMRAFNPSPTELALLFPYLADDAQAFKLVTPERLAAAYPGANAYLKEVRPTLEARERGRMIGHPNWYGYIYPKNFAVLSQPKLMIPDMSERLHVAVDTAGDLIFSGGAAGGNAIVPKDSANLLLFAGILNSSLLDAIKRTSGTRFRGGWLNCEIRFIRDLPIKLPETPGERTTAERIKTSVQQVISAKAKLLDATLSDRERSQQEQAADAAQRRIDVDVLTLYGLDALPS